MNRKETVLHCIANIVIETCSLPDEPVTKEQILGKCRTENVIMARCILVRLLRFAGFQPYTIMSILHYNNVRSVMHLETLATDFRTHNYLYQQCEDEAYMRFIQSKTQ